PDRSSPQLGGHAFGGDTARGNGIDADIVLAQFQRQAKRGLYWDNSYSLRDNPSSDYHALMNNTFTGWDEEDEARVNEWLKQGGS
ncbi:MAG: hypothetical protein QF473_36125, partial [Planctomycetota bacterium]|nr:hypothetical protein [Planctomycetota bacterium]